VLRSTEELFIAMVDVFLTFILNNSKSFHAATSGGFFFIEISSELVERLAGMPSMDRMFLCDEEG